MGKKETNRYNISYAVELRKKGFDCSVYALPADARDLVDNMLSRAIGEDKIANEVNMRYGDWISKTGWMRPISATAIKTYRDKYWKKTPEFKRMVTWGSDAIKKEVDKIIKDFDALKEMVNLAKKQCSKAYLADNLEDKTNLPSKRGDEARLQAFEMCSRVLDKEIELGIMEAVSRPESPLQPIAGSVNLIFGQKEELLTAAKEAIFALEGKGKYGKRRNSDKRISLQSGKE